MTALRQAIPGVPPVLERVLGALAFPVVVVDGANLIEYVNGAAEQFFEHGRSYLLGQALQHIVPSDSPVLSVVAQVRSEENSISEYDVDLVLPRGGGRGLSIHASPLLDGAGTVVLSIHAHGAARSMERQLFHRSAARSVSAIAAMLAHEVKNPLSGIRGAAQLLQRVVSGQDQELTRLICEEADRICALVDRMGVFTEDMALERGAVNIHEVLERAQQSAAAGFARHVRFSTDYDPSLPPVLGNRDQLIQVFLNLLKNAAEAVPKTEGEIRLGTAFRRGVRLAVPGSEGQVHLPLVVTVSDNGEGISDDIARHLFDPFVTTKSGGTGLGLALVAKVVNDHGGIVEFDTSKAGTTFRVFLPLCNVSERLESVP